MDKLTGRIRAGFEADLVVIDRKSLEDIRPVDDVWMVVDEGRIALNRRNVARRP